jgi:hypothetical protein
MYIVFVMPVPKEKNQWKIQSNVEKASAFQEN